MTHSLREMAHVFSRAKFVPFPLKRHLAHAGEFGGGNRLADAFGFVVGFGSAGDDGVWRPMCSVDVIGGRYGVDDRRIGRDRGVSGGGNEVLFMQHA